jgi:hypothetical protein
MVETIQNAIVQESQAEVQADPAQPDDGEVETLLAAEINTLWSDHVRLSADRKVTSKELRQIRARLAERLSAMKSLLSHPGRSGEWRGWLRQHGIPRSTADRLVSRYSETLCVDRVNVPSGAISDPATPTHEKLATSVWSSLKKTLATGESVVQFVGCFVTAAGIAHEWRPEGLMIFNPMPKAADGVIETTTAAEITCPVSQPAESGEANPADATAADPTTQPPQGGNAIPAETSAAEPAPPPSCETATCTAGPAAETSATPLAVEQAAAAVDAGGSDAA